VRLLRDRQIATGKLSLPAIGRMLEGRDHSTICHALATFDAEMDREPWAREIYERLKGAPADA
jgi:chromosomal replication initiation ATPase DnaA